MQGQQNIKILKSFREATKVIVNLHVFMFDDFFLP